MVALFEFLGNGAGGSVALRIYTHCVEYEHRNYLVVVPLSKVTTVSYSKDPKALYASVSIGDIKFGCDNKVEVYAALAQVLGRGLPGASED